MLSLADMRKVMSMASSGEMQRFIGEFQIEIAEIRNDRLALKKAFPQGFIHFNKRMDSMEAKLDAVLSLLTAGSPTVIPEQQENHHGNHGTERHERNASDGDGVDHDATGHINGHASRVI